MHTFKRAEENAGEFAKQITSNKTEGRGEGGGGRMNWKEKIGKNCKRRRAHCIVAPSAVALQVKKQLNCKVRDAAADAMTARVTQQTYVLSPTPRLLSSASVVMTRTAEEQTA